MHLWHKLYRYIIHVVHNALENEFVVQMQKYIASETINSLSLQNPPAGCSATRAKQEKNVKISF